MPVTEIKPDNNSSASKKQQVEQMFNDIAHKYDFLNRFLSLGIDRGWRKAAIKSIAEINPKIILDVATGTADLAIAALKLKPEHITGIDISAQMLAEGQVKIDKKGFNKQIQLMKGDSEALPFSENHFDAVTVAFGVRNFENLQNGINEMHRVLKPGGKIPVLESSKPKSFPYKQLYQFYFSNILPLWGGLISKSRKAYEYLPESVKHFPEGNDFLAFLTKAGFKQTQVKTLTFGTCSLYTAIK